MVATKKAEARKPRSDKKGLKFVGVRLEPWQDQALNAVARERAAAKGRLAADKSEVVREAIELHPEIKKRRS